MADTEPPVLLRTTITTSNLLEPDVVWLQEYGEDAEPPPASGFVVVSIAIAIPTL